MNCEQANQMDLVDYLYSISFQPQKIRGNDYWYLSPLREQKTPSFKINRSKNVWYDHGLGKGGTLVDFGIQFYRCDVPAFLEKLPDFSFQQQVNISERNPKMFAGNVGNNFEKDTDNPLFHQHTNKDERLQGDAPESAIKVIAANSPITDPSLCGYAADRKISEDILNRYCVEIHFSLNDKNYRAIGFKNNAGGFELRNEFFKAGSSPKYVTYFDNAAKEINVFEGFFDFLSYQVMNKDIAQEPANFLVLNSLSFFERSLLLMEKHEHVNLYLDRDEAGKKCTAITLQRSNKSQDKSILYNRFKDLNEWWVKGQLQQKERNAEGRHL